MLTKGCHVCCLVLFSGFYQCVSNTDILSGWVAVRKKNHKDLRLNLGYKNGSVLVIIVFVVCWHLKPSTVIMAL